MAIIFKECPVDLGQPIGIILCEDVKITILDILSVNKININFSAIFEFKLNNQYQRKIQILNIPHDMIGGNTYQQCYEYLKKIYNSKGYSNI